MIHTRDQVCDISYSALTLGRELASKIGGQLHNMLPDDETAKTMDRVLLRQRLQMSREHLLTAVSLSPHEHLPEPCADPILKFADGGSYEQKAPARGRPELGNALSQEHKRARTHARTPAMQALHKKRARDQQRNLTAHAHSSSTRTRRSLLCADPEPHSHKASRHHVQR